MRPVAIVLLIVALHVGIASVAASRHLLGSELLSIPLLSSDPAR